MSTRHDSAEWTFDVPAPDVAELVDRWGQALVSLVALVLLSPLLLLIGVAVKISSPGPVLYRGIRVGRREQLFTIYKFRTLATGAEQAIGARLLDDRDKDLYGTRFGRLLKRTKLDELPQLLNVLRGEMRLVGPRPVRPVFLESFKRDIPHYTDRFRVPPGITGIAQLRGGYYTSPRDKLRYDLRYIRRRSVLLDLKVLLFTGIKIVDHWLQTGFLILFLFLFVSFVPAHIQETLRLAAFGHDVNLVYVLILVTGAYTILTRKPCHFGIHPGPLNRGILLLLLVGLVSSLFGDAPQRILLGTGYYVVTGLLVAFVIVNSVGTESFLRFTLRAIALTSVVISLLGLIEVFSLKGGVALASADGVREMVAGPERISSVLGDPMLLAVYLVLGIPLLFAEVSRARTPKEHDFWLVCATISVIGIVFTQTRTGLVALLVAGAFFLAGKRRQMVRFVGAFLVGITLLATLGPARFSPVHITEEVRAWVQRYGPELANTPAEAWLLGAGPDRAWWSEGKSKSGAEGVPNMHITLAREIGLVGWLTLLWLIGAALLGMKRARDRVRDEDVGARLQAVMAALAGFLVSMNGMNTFHNLTLQIFFWCLVGIGLALASHGMPRSRSNLIWQFGDAGDA